MSKWLYYFSGILYGKFILENGDVTYRWLNHETARMSDPAPYDEAAEKELKKWGNLDVPLELGRLGAYESALSGEPDEADTAFGRYTRRDGEPQDLGTATYAQRDVFLPVDVIMSRGTVAAFVCPSRESTVVLAREGCAELSVLRQWRASDLGRPVHPVRFAGTFRAVMRDGAALATDVYLPGELSGRLPCVLVRTPYGKGQRKHLYYRYVQRGYAVVLQDVRGREESEGQFIPQDSEIEDGDDTLNWIAAQPWSNGSVGMIGGSYLGYVQWAAAASGNPHLAAMVSLVTSGSAFVDIPRRGGCFVSGMLAWAFAMSEPTMRPDLMAQDNWDELLDIRPLEDIPRRALGRELPFLSEWLRHPHNDAFWQRGDWQARWSGRQVPALIVSGWFDDNGMGTTQALDLTAAWSAGMRKVVLGPWNHNANSRYDIHGIPMGQNALRYDLDLLYLQWLDRHLLGTDNGIDRSPAVEYFTLSEGRWKTADSWPPAGGRSLSLYLDGDDAARDNRGTLSEHLPTDGQSAFTYDPANPATHVIDMSENELEVPEDYTEEERRDDVLCYTTPPLQEDLTVTGDVLAELYISSSAVDTDFVARITEVDETGRSIKLADGMLCAKYRNSFGEPALLEPDGIYQLSIRTTKLSKRFRKGTRLRLTVTSSAKNFTFPNSNTADCYNGTENVTARNTVYHGSSHPSRIILPVEA